MKIGDMIARLRAVSEEHPEGDMANVVVDPTTGDWITEVLDVVVFDGDAGGVSPTGDED